MTRTKLQVMQMDLAGTQESHLLIPEVQEPGVGPKTLLINLDYNRIATKLCITVTTQHIIFAYLYLYA